MSRVEVSNDELRTIRDATRELGKLVESGTAEKFVLTKHGQMRAVVVSLDSYTEMRPGSGLHGFSEAARSRASVLPRSLQ